MRPRRLATSVVITISLAQLGGCDTKPAPDGKAEAGKPGEGAVKPEKKTEPRSKQDALRPDPAPRNPPSIRNKPADGGDSAGADGAPAADGGDKADGGGDKADGGGDKADGGDKTKKPAEVDPFKFPANQLDLPKDKRIVLEANGTCVQTSTRVCKPGVHCNPPKPKAVKCPKELRLPKPKGDAEVYRIGLQTCWQRGESTCAEGEVCDPPPSTRVVCPKGI